jgi:hypothetical protein
LIVWSGPSALAFSSFSSEEEVRITVAPSILAKPTANTDTPPGALDDDHVAGLGLSLHHDAAPGGQAGAAERRDLLEGQVWRSDHQAVGGDGGAGLDEAVDLVAEHHAHDRRVRPAALPAGKKLADTRSPGFTRVTPGPTASTSAAQSLKGTRGSGRRGMPPMQPTKSW